MDKVNALASFAAIVPVGGTALKYGIKGIGNVSKQALKFGGDEAGEALQNNNGCPRYIII